MMAMKFPIAPRWRGLGLALGLAGLWLSSDSVARQPPSPPPARPDRDEDRPPPPPPDRLFKALDRDGDGRLSPKEIAGAAEALKGLDSDGDGSLSRDELFPPRPPRGGRRADGPPPPRDDRPTPAPDAEAVSPPKLGEEKVALVFRGGHETEPRDRGRPVALVGGALGVSPEVFRDAFSKVQPAPAGTSPTPEHARRNKAVLMAALGPLGITNDQIDRASNRYRYVQSRGELWPVKPAVGHAILKDGVITSIQITDPGFGYNAPPKVSVPGHPELALEAKIQFSRELERNGSVASVARVKGEVGTR